jgi:Holliday junction resolvase
MRKRSDGNMTAMVQSLIALGYSVIVLSGVGGGVPDLLVGRAGVMWLCEVKMPLTAKKPRTKTTLQSSLTEDQVSWHAEWKGPAIIVASSAEEFVRLTR